MSTATTMKTLRCNVADLLHHPGSRRTVHLEAPASELGGVGGSRVADRPLVVDVTFERVSDGVVVRGRIAGGYTGQCSRCLAPITRELSESIDELYEPHPVEGETYRLDGDELDLEPAVRDAILLDLPAAPLCGDDCAGLCPVCGTDRNVAPCRCDTSFPDPRWDALRELTFDN